MPLTGLVLRVLKSVIFTFSLPALSNEQFAVLGRQCHKLHAVRYSDKHLAHTRFVGFPARLPVCAVQSCRGHHRCSASILCVHLDYIFAEKEHVRTELLLHTVVRSLTQRGSGKSQVEGLFSAQMLTNTGFPFLVSPATLQWLDVAMQKTRCEVASQYQQQNLQDSVGL